ncbi:MAG: acetyl esterase/lipase [Halobacteriales archaeon]|jgi:acetyl esterase/lipase
MPQRSRRQYLGLVAGALAGCGATNAPADTKTASGTATSTPVENPETATRTPERTSPEPGSPTDEATPTPATTNPDGPPDRYEVTVRRGVTFRETPLGALKMDLYRPSGTTDRPLLVHVHGGAWRFGDKGYERSARRYAAAGIATASIQYRLSTQATYPGPVRDVVAAIRWARANADNLHIDPDRVALVGMSAGGHLAALVAAAPEERAFSPPDFHPEVSPAVSAVVGHSGVYDLTTPGLRGSSLVRSFVGASFEDDPDLYRAAAPIHRVDDEHPPTLLFHGTDDAIVPYPQATAYRDALDREDVTVSLFTGDGAGHVFYDADQWFDRTLTRQYDFLESKLSP